MECPTNAFTNSSTMGSLPTFLIVTLFTWSRSWMKGSFPFLFGTMNHLFEYGAEDGSNICMDIFSFSSVTNIGTSAFGIVIGRIFHGIYGIVNIIIDGTCFGSAQPISCGKRANAFSCFLITSMNFSFSSSFRNDLSPNFISLILSSVK
ncbi:hypothetical protein KP509_05G073200 [Ceratopteris richardii]|uniref:Uncharacterized protein n=1 Tax=Ceratopteris richardii TaxID=49495 RepID=A0A8T2UZK9_CERRI|nr:hypothetical protein KP509_05G073200 [Ceratopteris richardii]